MSAESKDEVVRQDERYMQAAIRPDIPTLESIMDDDYVFISGAGGGTMTNKEDHLASLTSGRLQYTSLTPSDVRVRMHGDTAILTSYVSVEGTAEGLDIRGKYLATRVYIKQGENWKIVLAHSTRS